MFGQGTTTSDNTKFNRHQTTVTPTARLLAAGLHLQPCSWACRAPPFQQVSASHKRHNLSIRMRLGCTCTDCPVCHACACAYNTPRFVLDHPNYRTILPPSSGSLLINTPALSDQASFLTPSATIASLFCLPPSPPLLCPGRPPILPVAICPHFNVSPSCNYITNNSLHPNVNQQKPPCH